MKQRIVLTMLAVIFLLQLQAQESKTFKHEISADLSTSVNFFYPVFQSSNYPYALNYRLFLNNSAIRVSPSFSYSNNENSSSPSYNNSMSAAIRLGYEYHFPSDSRFQPYIGIEGSASMTNSDYLWVNRDDEEYSNKTKTKGYGGSLVGGLRFTLNDRISIGTEGMYEVLYTNSTQTTDNSADNEDPETNDFSSFNTQFYRPVSLFVSFRF